MDREDEVNLPEDSDSDDEDFVPGGENHENLSEEEDDGEPEGKTGKKNPKKRNASKGRAGTGKKAKKRKGAGADSEEDSDDEDDQDYVLNERVTKNEISLEIIEDLEIVAAREKAEKARTDILWADFLNSVETSKGKKDQEKSGTNVEEKLVTKTYDFAGEKVEVKEKVKVSSDSETRSSTSSSISAAESSSANSDSKISSNSNGEPGSSNPDALPSDKPPLPRRVRISFLSGDPADIGLAGDKKISAREGLANVLNALHARNKKLGTLEKSKLDWEKYKAEQGIQEELESHNRSKHGYIDKQEFLQRADLRQFEIEKAARTKRRRNL